MSRLASRKGRIVLLWGVSGCGKSTVGRLLADRLGWEFFDADEYHPAANIEKMRAGTPLNDEDRDPWLACLATLLSDCKGEGRSAVLACSALKQDYRARLGVNHEDILAVHLLGSAATIRTRLSGRQHEFMNDELLASQFETLEPSKRGLSLDIVASPTELCCKIEGELESIAIQSGNVV